MPLLFVKEYASEIGRIVRSFEALKRLNINIAVAVSSFSTTVGEGCGVMVEYCEKSGVRGPEFDTYFRCTVSYSKSLNAPHIGKTCP